MMKPARKTAAVAAYIDAINEARKIGCTWDEVRLALVGVIDFSSAERLRRTVVEAKKALASGLYNPPQKPLPGDDDEHEHPHEKSPDAQNKPASKPLPAEPVRTRPAPGVKVRRKSKEERLKDLERVEQLNREEREKEAKKWEGVPIIGGMPRD